MKDKKIELKRTVNIDNFIATYDNYVSAEDCKKIINIFEKQSKLNLNFNRLGLENAPIVEKQDEQFFATGTNLHLWWEEFKTTMLNYNTAWHHYIKHTGAENVYKDFFFTSLKVQKTLPAEGYHVWHIEHGHTFDTSKRAFVFSIYLNDVEEGGETEFLHFSKRVKPKTGRIVIWPAAFPYLHRGNPPLSGAKYILTSWMMLRQ